MPRDSDAPLPDKPSYFWWLLANLLALCFAIASWIFCLEIFGHPEVPRNYEILRKLGRLPAIPEFDANSMPKLIWMGPEELWKLAGLDEQKVSRLNGQFVRHYINGFDEPLDVLGVHGDFEILQVRPLGAEDFFTQGVAVSARAMVKPDDFSKAVAYPVVLEYLFPSEEEALDRFAPGQSLEVRKTPHFAAVIGIGKQAEGGGQVVRVTVAPLVFGTCRMGRQPFALRAPESLNPGAVFPLF